MATVTTFINIWINAALLADLHDPREAIKPVTQVPIFAPKIIEIDAGNVITPLTPKAITRPVVAELLCMIPVSTAPANTPNIGVAPNLTRTSMIMGYSMMPSAPPDMVFIPRNNMPKPKRI